MNSIRPSSTHLRFFLVRFDHRNPGVFWQIISLLGALWSENDRGSHQNPTFQKPCPALAPGRGNGLGFRALQLGEAALDPFYDRLRAHPAGLTGARFAVALLASLPAAIAFGATLPTLAAAVVENSISAATRDTRFSPIQLDELPQLHLEISVLTPLRRITDPAEIVLGEDGIVLQVWKDKDVGIQLAQNPEVEMCFNNYSEGIQIRVRGRVELVELPLSRLLLDGRARDPQAKPSTRQEPYPRAPENLVSGSGSQEELHVVQVHVR